MASILPTSPPRGATGNGVVILRKAQGASVSLGDRPAESTIRVILPALALADHDRAPLGVEVPDAEADQLPAAHAGGVETSRMARSRMPNPKPSSGWASTASASGAEHVAGQAVLDLVASPGPRPGWGSGSASPTRPAYPEMWRRPQRRVAAMGLGRRAAAMRSRRRTSTSSSSTKSRGPTTQDRMRSARAGLRASTGPWR